MPPDDVDNMLAILDEEERGSKVAHEDARRLERRTKQIDRDIRKLAHAILQMQNKGTVDSRELLESLIEMSRRK